MNRETTDKRIVFLETRKVDNNDTREVRFVNLRPLNMLEICVKTYLLRKIQSNYTGVS